jgi:hypothetical protein
LTLDLQGEESSEMQTASVYEGFGRLTELAAALAIACFISACSGVKEKPGELRGGIDKARLRQPTPITTPTPAPPLAPIAKIAPPAPSVPKPSAASPAPFDAGTLSVRSACTARDQNGYTESIKLDVDRGRVAQLEAKIDIPRRGSCGFRLADFRQTRTEPHVELQSNNGSMCTVRMWQQGERFTVAFNECAEKCTRGAFDYVWPVQLNSADGSCL